MKRLIYFTLLQLFICVSMAAVPNKCIFSNCVTSKEMQTEPEPDKYMNYNDLTQISGDFENEYSNKILLRGIVVDKDCIPVPNAKILIWQRDEYGDYRYDNRFATAYEKYDANYKMYSQFKGNGTAFSNNTGKFSFITVKPSSSKIYNIIDGINAKVVAPGFNKFETKIFINRSGFESKMRSAKGVHANLNIDASKFYGQEVYDVYIVLDGLNKYRRY